MRPQGGIGGGEIDEITGVRNDRRDADGLGLLPEGTNLLLGERLAEPLVRVLGEDLQRFAPVQLGAGNGVGHAAGHGHVRADAHG